jgi:Right handed beta helix region
MKRLMFVMCAFVALTVGISTASAGGGNSDGAGSAARAHSTSPVRPPRPAQPVQMPTRPSGELVPHVAVLGRIECGDVVSESVRLTRDLTCSGDGLIVGCRIDGPPSVTGPVTVNLAGHTIRGRGQWTGLTICSSYPVTILNGTVRNFALGVWSNSDTTLQNMTIAGNGTGVYYWPSHLIVSHSAVVQNGGDGIVAADSFSGLTVDASTVSRNGGYGVNLLTYGNGGAFSNSEFTRNGLDGIVSSYSCGSFFGNRASGNGGSGINIFDGIDFATNGCYQVGDNRADRNGQWGISLQFGGGEPTPPYQYDAGGNTAKGNGQPAQCRLLTCS